MLRVLAVLFTGIIFSFYYFPFEFRFLPGVNTKMMLAVIGIAIAVLNLVKNREVKFPQNLMKTFVCAIVVSLVGVVTVIFNNTPDYAYASYFVSMMVWLSGAYAVCSLIKKVHGELVIERVVAYMVGVCIIQCMLALIIDSNMAVKELVDTYIMQDQKFLTEVERLYGIGASLDTAGVRFSACLIMLAYVINTKKSIMTTWLLCFSILAFIVLTVVGNMIARTTIIGVLLSLIYSVSVFRPQKVSYAFLNLLKVFVVIIIVAIPLSVYLYNNNDQFYELSRFAFEGFFNLVETGEWKIDSNEKLKSMIVFPESVKTWIIGDGYFSNPYNTDPYYVGELTGGYYKGTDIGFLRFVFYFGIIGLLAFSCFFITVAKECIVALPKHRILVFFILLLGFVIWLKVATDVFLVFALFLCVGNMQEESRQIEINL